MSAFDTSLTPVAVTPANTSNTTLDPGQSDDCSILVNVVNIGAAPVTVQIGITPSGGSVFWIVFDLNVPVGESALSFGPWFFQVGDVVTVQTDQANDATFSLTGVESTP